VEYFSWIYLFLLNMSFFMMRNFCVASNMALHICYCMWCSMPGKTSQKVPDLSSCGSSDTLLFSPWCSLSTDLELTPTLFSHIVTRARELFRPVFCFYFGRKCVWCLTFSHWKLDVLTLWNDAVILKLLLQQSIFLLQCFHLT